MKELKSKTETLVSSLGKFDAKDFETHEDAFCNLLSQTLGVISEKLDYAIWDSVMSANLPVSQQRIYDLPLTGAGYEEDNKAVFKKLKEFLLNTPGYA